MSMHGTRDAAQNWGESYGAFLEQLGFSRGKASPCIFYHGERGLRIVVHGDDFTVMGKEAELDWLRREVVRLLVKFRGRLWPEEKDDKAVRVLNRVVAWTQ